MRYSLLSILMIMISGLSAAEFTELTVYPEEVLLDNKRDYQNITVQAFHDDGTTKNVLTEAEVKIANPELCKFENGKFIPLKDGKTEASVSFNGKVKTIKLEVKNSEVDKVVSFNLDIYADLHKSRL